MAFIDSGKSINKDDNYQEMKKRMNNLDIVQYSLRVPSALYKQVRIKLAHDGLSLKSVLVEMLEEYIKK